MKAQCPYCDKEFKNRRGLPGHIKLCPKAPNNQQAEQQEEQHDCNDHLKLLKKTNMKHLHFIKMGYKSYCEVCEEVY